MTKTNALPRPIGATVLVLCALALAALALPATGLAAPPPGGGPQLALAPSPAILPTTTVGNQSQAQEFVVINEGEGEAFVEKAFLAGADAGEFNLGPSNCNGASLQQGQQCSVSVSFVPGNTGERQAVLGFQLSGYPDSSFGLSATGAAPHLSFRPGSYDFGLQPIHSESVRANFQIENDGEAGVQLSSLNFTGGDSNGFWFGNSNCYGRWMQPGESCSVEIDFGPSEAGSYATQLQASTSNGANFTANLSGEGGRPVVEAFPNPADFGAVTVGSTGATQTIVVHNSGNVSTGFFIGIVAGGDAGSFQLLDENCTDVPLMPSGSCTAQVRFRPQSSGAKLARLAFFGEGEGGTMVALSGEGVAPAVTLAPSSFDFGSAVVGTKSDPQSFAVRNEGSTPLDFGAAAIVGADLDQFSLSGDDCSGATLEPGGEYVIRVRFAPDSIGAKTARLRVSGDAEAFTVSLSGLGRAVDGSSQGAPLAAQASAAQAQSPAASPPAPYRGRGRHHRRFVRGDAVVSARSRRPGRDLRGTHVPR